MEKQEELLSYFKRKANEILFKYSIKRPDNEYGYQYLRMASYFGQFNENMHALESELNSERDHILSTYLKEDMDIPGVVDGLNSYRHNTKLQYIILNNP